MDVMICSAASPVMPLRAMPSRSCIFDLLHPPLGSLEAHRPAQLLGLAAGEPGGDHRNSQQLFLEERHAKRARENRLERRMRVLHRLAPRPAIQVRMHHLPDDGAGPDDGHLHDDVVEAGGLQTRQRRHLRARFDLEDADRVGFLQHLVNGRIVLRQVREIDSWLGLVAGDSRLVARGSWLAAGGSLISVSAS